MNNGGAANKPQNKLAITSGQGVSDGGYDAVANRQRRREVSINLKSEDWVLRPWDRDKMVSHTRSLRRNASIVSWAVRKHLDYVSTFSFQCRTGDKSLDREVEALMNWWSRPLNCDVGGRHSLQKLIRMAEALATTDGDVFVMKLSDGKLQLIEGDKVRTPSDLGAFKGLVEPAAFTHGVATTASGKATAYAICERTGQLNGFTLKSVVPAQYVYQHGYFDRYDQLRGISPLASAINSFCDLYEASEYALAKMKLSQLFALKLTRSMDVVGDTEATPYSFNFGTGPQVLDLDHGDDAQFMESATPSDQFQAFMEKGIAIGLKSLDIPYSFFDESHTNYSGARQALLQYEQSCAAKRDSLKQLMNALTVWRLGLFVADGHLTLPNGWGLEDLKFEYIPAPLPWIDPQKEANAQILLINNKLSTRSAVCKENGTDFFEIVEQLAQEEQAMKAAGLMVEAGEVTPTDTEVTNEDGDVIGTVPAATTPAAEAEETGQELQTTQATVLNGAQISSALQIVSAVVAGDLPRDSGVAMLVTLFNLTEEQAERIMGSAGTATPTTPNPKPAGEAGGGEADSGAVQKEGGGVPADQGV